MGTVICLAFGWHAASTDVSPQFNACHQFLPLWICLHEWKSTNVDWVTGHCDYSRLGVMRDVYVVRWLLFGNNGHMADSSETPWGREGWTTVKVKEGGWFPQIKSRIKVWGATKEDVHTEDSTHFSTRTAVSFNSGKKCSGISLWFRPHGVLLNCDSSFNWWESNLG